MVAKHGIYDHDLKKEIKILVKLLFLLSIIEFNMMKLLAVLQVKTGKFVMKESNSHQPVKLHIASQFLLYNKDKILTFMLSARGLL